MVKKYKKLVSIIIRGKNESRWLKILLRELKKQTIKDFEIIFCDNYSDDNSLKILKKYKVKKIIRFKKYIPGYILNKAIKKSSGRFICILSAHCIPVSSKWLEEHFKEINKNSKIAATFGKQMPMPGTSVQNLIDLDIIFKDQPVLYKKDPYLNNANAFYRAEILKKNLFNPKLTNIEDRIWAKNITQKGFAILYSARAAVFHLHGVHQHENKSNRAENTYKILINKYKKIWSKCEFLKTNYYKFGIILNGRRINNKKKMFLKLTNVLQKIKFNKKLFKKIILINPLNQKISYKSIQNTRSKKTLKEDLNNIYKKFSKDFIDINYVVYINLDENINFNKILKLIFKTIYNNFESSTFGEKVKENFLINMQGTEQFRSTNLETIENKPTITLLKWAKGSVLDTDYIRKGILFTNKTHISFQ